MEVIPLLALVCLLTDEDVNVNRGGGALASGLFPLPLAHDAPVLRVALSFLMVVPTC